MLDHGGCGDARLAAPDGPGQDGARLVVAGQDLADAAVRDAQLPADVARPDAELRQLHDPEPNGVGERPAVDEHAAELVHLAEGWLWWRKQTHTQRGRTMRQRLGNRARAQRGPPEPD